MRRSRPFVSHFVEGGIGKQQYTKALCEDRRLNNQFDYHMASLSELCVGKMGCTTVANISCISRNLFLCSGIPTRLTQPSLEIYTDLRALKFIEAKEILMSRQQYK